MKYKCFKNQWHFIEDFWDHSNVCLIQRETSVLAGKKGVQHLFQKILACDWEVGTIKKMCVCSFRGDVNYFLVLVRRFVISRDTTHHPRPELRFYKTLTLRRFLYISLYLISSLHCQTFLIPFNYKSFLDFTEKVHSLILQLCQRALQVSWRKKIHVIKFFIVFREKNEIFPRIFSHSVKMRSLWYLGVIDCGSK